MRDLRVSVTDRCNFRCLYCLPESDEAAAFYQQKTILGAGHGLPKASPITWKARDELLTFEEIERVVRLFTSLGIEKIRLTGGEPLLRRGLEDLVKSVASMPGVVDLAMTTNGFLFPLKGAGLAKAGLRRVSFSMDSLDPENFKRMTGRAGLQEVMSSIRLAASLGLAPVKVNAVVIRGINDHEIETLADFAIQNSLVLRFIEFMPLDSGKTWQRNMVVPGREILDRLSRSYQLKTLPPKSPSETARRWQFEGSNAELGVIAPVTEPFCGHCNRIRLTADGRIRTCLFSLHEHDLKGLLRSGCDDATITARIREIVLGKEERHHIGEADFVQPDRPMSCIGG